MHQARQTSTALVINDNVVLAKDYRHLLGPKRAKENTYPREHSEREVFHVKIIMLNTEKLSPVIRESHDSSAREITKMTHHEWVNQCISHAV